MKPVIVTLSVVLLLDLALAGGLYFGWDRLASAKSESAAVRQEIATERMNATKSTTLTQTLAAIAPLRARLHEFFYIHDDEDGLRFVKEIESLARIAGVDAYVQGADFAGSAPNTVFRMNIRFAGSLANVYRYLGLLESFPARIALVRYNIRVEERGSSEEKWGGDVSVELRSIREPGETP